MNSWSSRVFSVAILLALFFSATAGIVWALSPLATLSIIVQSPRNASYASGDVWMNATITDSNGTCIYALDSGTVNYSMTNSSGNWSNLSTSLAEGAHNVTFFCNDTTGNWSSNSTWFTVDLTPPIIAISSPQNATYNYNVSNSTTHSVWANATLDETGRCNRSLDGGSNVSLSNTTGNHNNLMTSVSDGFHNVTFWCNDSAGNMNSTSAYFTLDTAAPNVAIISPGNRTYNSTTISLDYYVNDSGVGANASWFEYNGTNTTLTTNTTFTAIENNVSTLTLWANDSLGKLNHTSVTFSTDTIFPHLYIILPTNATYNTTNISLQYYANDNVSGISWVWYDYNGTNTTLTGNRTFTAIADNLSSLTLWTNDSAGNTVSNVTWFTTDVSAPNITLISPQHQVYGTANLSLNYNVSDAISGVNATWYSYNGTNTTLFNGSNITVVINTTFLALENVVSNITVWANDSVGHVARSTVNFTIDTLPPFVVIIDPRNQSYDDTFLSLDYYVHDAISEVNATWYSYNETNVTLSGNTSFWAVNNASSTLLLCANDTFGRTNCTNVTFNATHTRPEIVVESPTNATYGAASMWLNVSVYDTDGLNSTWYSLNNGTNVSIGNYTNVERNASSNTSFTALQDRISTITVWANDSRGNVSYRNVTFTADVSSPNGTVNRPLNLSIVKGSSVTLNATAMDPGLSIKNVTFYYDTTLIGADTTATNNWFSTSWNSTAAPDGNRTVWFYAYDNANHSNLTSVVVTVDNTAPSEATITNPSNGSVRTGVFEINVTATDATVGVRNVTFFFDGTYIGNDTSGADGWSLAWSPSAYTNGWHNLNVTVYDFANNSNTTGVRINLSMPQVTITGPEEVDIASDSTFTIGGLVSNNGTSSIYGLNLTYYEIGSCTKASGTLNQTYNTTLAPGRYWNSTSNLTNVTYNVQSSGSTCSFRIQAKWCDDSTWGVCSNWKNSSRSVDFTNSTTPDDSGSGTPGGGATGGGALIDISLSHTSVSGYPGDTKSLTADVTNYADVIISTFLTYTLPDCCTVSYTPTGYQTLSGGGGSTEFNIEVKLKSNAVPGDYIITFTAKKAANTAVQDSANLTVHVLQSETSASCGDGTCASSESCSSCPSDCGACSSPNATGCGNGVCGTDESCSSCPSDCGACGWLARCGDGVCGTNESCSSCPLDCGACNFTNSSINVSGITVTYSEISGNISNLTSEIQLMRADFEKARALYSNRSDYNKSIDGAFVNLTLAETFLNDAMSALSSGNLEVAYNATLQARLIMDNTRIIPESLVSSIVAAIFSGTGMYVMMAVGILVILAGSFGYYRYSQSKRSEPSAASAATPAPGQAAASISFFDSAIISTAQFAGKMVDWFIILINTIKVKLHFGTPSQYRDQKYSRTILNQVSGRIRKGDDVKFRKRGR